MSNRFFWNTHFPDIDDGFKRYLEENGDLYDADRSCSTSDRSWGWVRKKKEEEGKNKTNSRELLDKLCRAQVEEMIRKSMEANKPVGLPVDEFNAMVKDGAWDGGYVQTLGYVEVAASSLYGNSIYLSSWIPCGEQNNPVPVRRFYELSKEGRWGGGHVGNWGYVSNTQHIPGSSLNLESAGQGEEIVGCIANAQNMIAYGSSVDSVKESLKQYYDKSRNEFVVENYDLYSVLNRYFIVNALYRHEDINKALSDHKVVFLRMVDRIETVKGETHKYGKDYLVLDSSVFNSEYILLDTFGCKIFSIGYKDITNDNNIVFSLEQQ